MTDVSKLVPFTGFYSMNVARGAFLSIDTVEERTTSAGQPVSPVQETTKVSISVSMDGASSTTYSFSDGATFDGITFTIPGHLTLAFTRQYRDGRLASFAGTIEGVPVDGETYYNRVPLSAFVADYHDVQTSQKALSIKDTLVISFDFSIFSTMPGNLQWLHVYASHVCPRV